MTTTTATRYFGRCEFGQCKHRGVTETLIDNRWPDGPCPSHGNRFMVWRPLKATYNITKECNGRCMGAIGPACDCSCGGDNHGTNSL